MLVVDSSQRKGCDEVWSTLRRMLDRCLRDDEYATARNPWCNNVRASVSHQVLFREQGTTTTQLPTTATEEPQFELSKRARKRRSQHKRAAKARGLAVPAGKVQMQVSGAKDRLP